MPNVLSRHETGRLINIPRDIIIQLTARLTDEISVDRTEVEMPTAEPAGGGPEGGRSPDRGGQKTVCLFKSQRSRSVSTAPGTSEMNACPRGTKTRPEPLQTTVFASGEKLLLNDTDLPGPAEHMGRSEQP